MLKNYLNPVLLKDPNNPSIKAAVRFYLDQAMEAKAEDWDVLVKSMLPIKEIYSEDKWNSYRDYIINESKKDLKVYQEKLNKLETSNDPIKNKARTESYYNHVIHDAEYALTHLAER